MNMKKDRLRGLHCGFELDRNYTSEEASKALKVVYNYLEQTKALNQNLINKLNEIKFVIETAATVENTKKNKKK